MPAAGQRPDGYDSLALFAAHLIERRIVKGDAVDPETA
jgi:hypothetical protein